MTQHTNCISTDRILYVLTDEDMAGNYDARHEEGDYDALSGAAKDELFHLVKKNLEHGLGAVWDDYMDAAIYEALRYRQVD